MCWTSCIVRFRGHREILEGREPRIIFPFPSICANVAVMKAALMTLGCKLNQADTMALAGILTEAGYQITPWNEKADLYLINTCTVTSSTDQQSRQAIRQAVRRNPSALIIVTGCYAQIDPQTIARLDGVDLVLGNQEKPALQEHLKGLSKDGLPRIFAGDISTRRTYQGVEGQMTCLRTRPLLKIQEGCNGSCTYCVIPRARGPERSLPPPQAKRQLSNLLAQGFQEIVLTGIRLGAYGQDLPEPASLYGLVEDFLQTPGSWRLRLSSLEPQDISAPVFIRAFQQWDRLCRHLHLPLQSGDDEILTSMNRTYRAETYRKLVEDLAHQVPGISLGTDIIVGFPGETPAHFHRTRRFLQELPLSYFHVFPFSPRPGTPAATLAGMVPAREKRERVSQLRSLSRKKSEEFRQSFLGRELQVIVLRKRNPHRGWWWALSDNYLPILVRDGTEEMIGRLLPIEVEAMEEGALLGRWRK